jgi:tRNA-2-methylthio-N6-dimethylallyladenosine synthase
VEFSERLIATYARIPKLANQLHLPVQSGSDRILGMMKRGHTASEYKEKIRRLREVRPGISLSSDFIVGYPTETEADFQATMSLIEEIRFDHAFSFLYSKRPGTPAAMLVDNVSQEQKEQRLQMLQARIGQLSQDYSSRLVGSVQSVLAEKPSAKNPRALAGRTACGRWVNFDSPALDPARVIGQFLDVEITEVMSNSLRGRVLARTPAAA